ncbi:hypothetical protein KY285_023731 [Solanum tuberosum]|nr:hypothetical protein KY289_024063 [Solanum tuberosum]KAH0675930.1 hypothetical protein KY285_023731 [Solanum tuberosum]
MVALLETRMTSHVGLKDEFGFDDFFEVPVVGRSGGLVLLWNTAWVTVTRLRHSDQEIHAMIQVLPDHKLCLTDLWCVVGDFNEILRQQEKWDGNSTNRSRSSRFWSCVNHCNLIGLGFKGSHYTWYNHMNHNKGLILERLDRCFANEKWLAYYPNAIVTHLPKTHSDHHPLLVTLSLRANTRTSRSFRLESNWLQHPKFRNIVNSSWLNRDLVTATDHFKGILTYRSKNTFGDIFKRKNRLLARLDGIQKSMSYPYSIFLHQLEQDLIKEYNNILQAEEDY